ALADRKCRHYQDFVLMPAARLPSFGFVCSTALLKMVLACAQHEVGHMFFAQIWRYGKVMQTTKPLFVCRSLPSRLLAQKRGQSQKFLQKQPQIVHFSDGAQDQAVFVNAPTHPVQRDWIGGDFHHGKSLQILKELLAVQYPEPVIYDIGAHGGNHSLYALQHMNAKMIVPFEIQPQAIKLYRLNVMLNNACARVDMGGLGFALGADFATLTGQYELSEIAVRPLDSFQLPSPNLLIIQMSGRYQQILEGARTIFRDHQPLLCVNRGGQSDYLSQWAAKSGYTNIVQTKELMLWAPKNQADKLHEVQSHSQLHNQ
ncbi:MAG: hypothetical protein AAF352_05675, partial [Pseudomonadota bacterium]